MFPPGTERHERIRVADGRGGEVTARAEVERQRVQILARHARRDLRALRVEQRRIGDDVDFFGQVADLQLGVDTSRLANEDANPFLTEAAETRQFDVEMVGADRHLHDACSCRSASSPFRTAPRFRGSRPRRWHPARRRRQDLSTVPVMVPRSLCANALVVSPTTSARTVRSLQTAISTPLLAGVRTVGRVLKDKPALHGLQKLNLTPSLT